MQTRRASTGRRTFGTVLVVLGALTVSLVLAFSISQPIMAGIGG